MMGFASPESFGWALLALVVAALYLWRSAPRQYEVATFSLWQRALARRPAWFALRFWLSFGAQIAFVLLIVTALAEPFWKQITGSPRDLVLVLDVSASMSAVEGPSSRFEAMRSEARRMIENLRPGEQMAILSAGATIHPIGRWGASRQSLLAAVDALQPTDGPTRISDAVALAADLLRGRLNAHIVVLTDATFPEASTVGNLEGVRLVLIGSDGTNAAITHLAARRQQVDPSCWDVLVEVANRGSTLLQTELQIGVSGTDPEEIPLEIARGQTVQHALTITAPAGGLLQAQLMGVDHLAADNWACLRLPPSIPERVQLIAAESPEAAALANALRAMTHLHLDVARKLPDKFDPQAIYVVHRQVLQEIPPGRWFVLDPEGDSDLWAVGGTLAGAQATVVSLDAHSELMSEVNLADVVFERASQLQFQLPARSLAVTASGDAVYSKLDRPEGPVLVFHASLRREHSDLVMRPDLTHLVQNAVRWLATARNDVVRIEDPRAGRVGRVWSEDRFRRVVGVATADVVQLPAGQRIQWVDQPGQPGQVLQGPLVALDRVGFWESEGGVPAAERSSRAEEKPPVPANLMDASESTLVRAETVQADELPLADVVSDHPLWMLLAALAIVWLVVEWCLYQRRIVV
jgi:hypothetical protein